MVTWRKIFTWFNHKGLRYRKRRIWFANFIITDGVQTACTITI